MPSHKIHLAIAKRVNEKLKLDLDSVMLGSVLPDLTITKDHGLSHYQVAESYEDELANPDKFIKEYKNCLNNPVMVGYLIHILTDRYYNDIFFQKHCVFDEKGKACSVKLRNGMIKSPIKKYKQSDFAKYDKWLLKNNYVSKFVDIKCVDNVKDLSVGKFDKEKLIEYIYNANKEVDSPRLYRISSKFLYTTLTKNELDKLFGDCCNYILDYLKFKISK